MHAPALGQRGADRLPDGRIDGRPGGLQLDLARHRGRVAGGRLQPGGQPGDRLALLALDRLLQRAERDQQRDRFVGGQPKRSGEVVGVGDVDASLAVDGLHVDLDQVARHQPGQSAVPEHVEVGAQLLLAHTEEPGDVGHPGIGMRQQVRQQREQPADLGLCGRRHVRAAARRRCTHAAPARLRAWSPLITAARRSGGSSTTTASA